MKRAKFIILLACVPLLWAAYDVAGPPGRAYASMEVVTHVCSLTDCGAAEHLTWGYLYESDPSITNCDDSSYYGHCAVTTGTDCHTSADCPSEACVAYDIPDQASKGRCNLMPGVYRMSLSAQGTFIAATCLSGLAIANTTVNWPSTVNMFSKIQIWTASNSYDVTDSFMSMDSGIVTVTEQSWVEARFNTTCANVVVFDGGAWVIERLSGYTP